MSKAEQEDAFRVYRGGCWYYTPAIARVASRAGLDPGFRDYDLGVRLVRRRSALERLAESLRGVSDEKEG